jgi:hypothetical protein
LQQAAGEEPFADGALEAVEVGRFGEGELVGVVGDDFGEFVLYARIGWGETAEGAEGVGGLDGGDIRGFLFGRGWRWRLTCSGLFCLMRKRGVSGRKMRPMTMIRLHAN